MKASNRFSLRGEWENVEDKTQSRPQSGTNDKRNGQDQPVNIISNSDRLGKRRLCVYNTTSKLSRKCFGKNKMHSGQASRTVKSQISKCTPKDPDTRNTEQKSKSFSVNRTTSQKGKEIQKRQESDQRDTVKNQEPLTKVCDCLGERKEQEKLNPTKIELDSETIHTLEIKRVDPTKLLTLEILIRGNAAAFSDENGIICRSILHKPQHNEKEVNDKKQSELDEQVKSQCQVSPVSKKSSKNVSFENVDKTINTDISMNENKREPEQICRSRSPIQKTQYRNRCIPFGKCPCKVCIGKPSRKSPWGKRKRSPCWEYPSKDNRSPNRESPSTVKSRSRSRESPSTVKSRSPSRESPSTVKSRSPSRESPSTVKSRGPSRESPSKEKNRSPSRENTSTEKNRSPSRESPSEEKNRCRSWETPPEEKNRCPSRESPSEEKNTCSSRESQSKEKNRCQSRESPSKEKNRCQSRESPSKEKNRCQSRESPSKEKIRCPSRESPSKERNRSPCPKSPLKENNKDRKQVSVQELKVEKKVSKPSQNSAIGEKRETEKKSGASSPRIKSRSKVNITNTRTPSEQRGISEDTRQDFIKKDTPKVKEKCSETSQTSQTSVGQCTWKRIDADLQPKEKDKTQIQSQCSKLKTSCRKMVTVTSSVIHNKRTLHNIRFMRPMQKPVAASKRKEQNHLILKPPLQQCPKGLPKNSKGQIHEFKSRSRNIGCQPSERINKYRHQESEKSIEIARNDLEEAKIMSSGYESKSERENKKIDIATSMKSLSNADGYESNNNVDEHIEEESRYTQTSEQSETYESTPRNYNRVCVGYAQNQVDKPTPGRTIVKSINAKSEPGEPCEMIYCRRSVQNLVRSQSLPPSRSEAACTCHSMHTDPSSSFESFFRALEFNSLRPRREPIQWKIRCTRKKPGVKADKIRKKIGTRKRRKKRRGMKLKCSRTRTLLHRTTTESLSQTNVNTPENT